MICLEPGLLRHIVVERPESTQLWEGINSLTPNLGEKDSAAAMIYLHDRQLTEDGLLDVLQTLCWALGIADRIPNQLKRIVDSTPNQEHGATKVLSELSKLAQKYYSNGSWFMEYENHDLLWNAICWLPFVDLLLVNGVPREQIRFARPGYHFQTRTVVGSFP